MQLEWNLNGDPLTTEIAVHEMLIDVLRERMDLPGTKVGCREGECGSCTVLIDGKAINACLYPAAKVQKRAVITIEGIGTADQPHALQLAMAELGASQCGYCTPGFIMSGVAVLSENGDPNLETIMAALAGNLCRCTGYVKIIHAVQKTAQEIGRT